MKFQTEKDINPMTWSGLNAVTAGIVLFAAMAWEIR